MEKILSRLKKIFVGLDRKKEQFGISIDFYEQKETATVTTSDCPENKK